MFYASYLRLEPANGHKNREQHYSVPHSCAQEFCGERQLPAVPFTNSPSYPGKGCPQPPQETPTIDIAYASYIFEKASAWSRLLQIDTELRSRWLDVASALPPYPVAQYGSMTDCKTKFPWAVSSNCTGLSEATDSEDGAVLPPTLTPTLTPSQLAAPHLVAAENGIDAKSYTSVGHCCRHTVKSAVCEIAS